MSYTVLKNRKDVIRFLSKKIKNAKGPVIIQAGHFALIPREDKDLVPAIVDNLKTPSLKEKIKNHPYMGSFPTETWKMALALASEHCEKDVKISVIVNDWQWVNKAASGRSDDLRAEFYQNNKNLPESYKKLLAKYHLPETILLPFESETSCLFFGEQNLRKIAKETYPEVDYVSSGKSCAYGYLPFLDYIYKHAAQLLISFTPRTCKGPIDFATDKFVENDGNKLSVVNVFLNGVFHKDFFENTELTTFNL